MKSHKVVARAGVLILAIILIASVAMPVLALESRGGDNVVIAADEVIDDDLYVGAGTFTLDGTVKGDLVVFGGTITINGTVEGDLLAVGQAVIINGAVEDDVRASGAAITVSSGATIGDDLVGGAYSLEMANGSQAGGDLLFGGFQALLAGDIAGDVKVAANSVAITGSVGGDVEAEVGEAGAGPSFSPFMFMPDMPQLPTVPGGLSIGPNASIGGKLSYTGPVEIEAPAGIETEYTTPAVAPGDEVEEAPSVAQRILNWVLDLIRSFISLLIVGLLVVWLAPKCVKQFVDILEEKPLPSLGWGVAAIFAIPIALLITVGFSAALAVIFGVLTFGDLSATSILIGLYLGFSIFLVAYLMAVWGAKIIVSVWLGRLIAQRSSTTLEQSKIWPFLIGMVIVILLTAIPLLGGLIGFVITLLGLGALGLWLWQAYKGETAAA